MATEAMTRGVFQKETTGALAFSQTLLIALFLLVIVAPRRILIHAGPFSAISTLELFIWLAFFWILITQNLVLTTGPKSLLLALSAPVFINSISMLWTDDPVSTSKIIIYSIDSFLGYIVALNIVRDRSAKAIAGMLGVIAAGGVLLAFLYWLRVPFIWNIAGVATDKLNSVDKWSMVSTFSRLDSPFWGRSNDLAAILAPFLIFFIGMARFTRDAGYRNAAFILAIMTGIALTFSRGVIICTLLVLLIAMFVRPTLKGVTLTLLPLLLIIPAVITFSNRVDDMGLNILDDRFQNTSNIENRYDRVSYGLELMRQSPILGYGGGRYLSKDSNENDSAFHNTYLEQLVSYGLFFGTVSIVALLSLPWFFFRFGQQNLPLRNLALFLGLAVILYLMTAFNQTINEAMLPSLLFRIFLGFCVAFLYACKRESAMVAA